MATVNYSWNLPTVGGDEDAWGGQLNANWTALDTLLGGVSQTEFAILDGATVTTAELNILDGVTATTAELNILDGVTATTAELNILDGVTATASEINLLDGAVDHATAAWEAGTATEAGLPSPADVAAAIDAQTGITLDTAVTPSSVAAVDFPDIPAGVNRITIMFDGLTKSGSDILLIQIGDAGGVETTGYEAGSQTVQLNSGIAGDYPASGFPSSVAGSIYYGQVMLSRLSGNTWVVMGVITNSSNQTAYTAGSKTLSAELDRVRITTVAGADNFTAGTINVSWEF